MLKFWGSEEKIWGSDAAPRYPRVTPLTLVHTIFTYLSLADKYTDKLLYLKQKHRDEQFRN